MQAGLLILAVKTGFLLPPVILIASIWMRAACSH